MTSTDPSQSKLHATLLARMAAGARVKGPSGLPDLIALDSALGEPGAKNYTVQIVGTNGKGSTSSMLAHALVAKGLLVGLFTSPHIYRVNERIRVNDRCIDDATLFELCEQVAAQEKALGICLTFFELLTMLALLYFEQQGVDVILLEAGLGGRLDSTRVRLASLNLFTPIALDHQAVLGPTLTHIAQEKAAVMHKGAPALTALQDPTVMRCLQSRANQVQTTLRVVPPLSPAAAHLPGDFQQQNAALALSAAQSILASRGQRSREVDAELLQGWSWPGRLEISPAPQGGGVVWDVAHNPHAVQAVLRSLRTKALSPSAVYCFCPIDKDKAGMLAALHTLACPVYELDLEQKGNAETRSVDQAKQEIDAAQLAGQWVLVIGSHRLIAALRPGPASDQLQDPVARTPFAPA